MHEFEQREQRILTRSFPPKRRREGERNKRVIPFTTSPCPTTSLGELEQTGTVVDGVEGIGKHEGKDGHQLHNNVESGSRSILEGISDGVSDNGGLVDIGSLALEIRVGGRLFDVLLGVVPGTSGVGHGNSELDGGHQGSDKETGNGRDPEQDTREERRENDHGTGSNHLLERSLGGNGNAGIVVGTLCWMFVQQVWLLVELSLDFHDHLHGSHTDGLHGESGKGEGNHSSDDQERKGDGFEHVDTIREQSVSGRASDASDKGSKQSQRNQGSRSNGESLSDGGGGVSGGIQGVGLFANTGVELGHFGDTSGVVTDGSVDINGETGGEVGQEANGGEGHTVHVTDGEREVDDEGQDDDGNDGGLESEGDTVDHVGGGSGLARVGELANGCVRVGGVVFGDQTNGQSPNGSHGDAVGGLERGEGQDFVSDSGVEVEGSGQVVDGGVVDGWDHDNGGADELYLEGALDVGFLLDGPDVGGNEGADQADKDTHRGDHDGEDHGVPSPGDSNAASNDQGGAGRFGKGSKEIGSHSGNVSNVVTDIVGNGGGVAWIVLGDSVNDLSDQIGSDVGGLGVDSSSDTSKHGNDGSSQPVSGEGLGEIDPFLGSGIVLFEDQGGSVEHKDSHTTEGESHDGSGTEGGVEARGPAGLLCRDSGADVREDGDLHSKVSRGHRGEGTEQEGNSGKASTGHIPSGSPGDEDKDENGKAHDEPEADGVFGPEEGFGSLVDGLVDLIQAIGGECVVGSALSETLLFSGSGGGLDGDLGNDLELHVTPQYGNDGAAENKAGGPTEKRHGDGYFFISNTNGFGDKSREILFFEKK
mmetsp:Transcript_15491/g.42951  ORF Transcript_15491/g.42951 Transcript_15491/m.42951 type:complete len:818 (-) Transcript_15491:8-2461(-)